MFNSWPSSIYPNKEERERVSQKQNKEEKENLKNELLYPIVSIGT